MTDIKNLAGRMHGEFCNLVDEVRAASELGWESSTEAVTRRWSLALDILSRSARVHSGAMAVVGEAHPALRGLNDNGFCLSWYRDFARLRNLGCALDQESLTLTTCNPCKHGNLPCTNSLAGSTEVLRGMRAAREMRNRYEHYEEYFLGNGNAQRAVMKNGRQIQRATAKPFNERWVSESVSGGTGGVEIRIDVYERGGLRTFVLNAEKTAQAMKPVVRAVVRDARIVDQRHEDLCTYCQ